MQSYECTVLKESLLNRRKDLVGETQKVVYSIVQTYDMIVEVERPREACPPIAGSRCARPGIDAF